MPKKLNQEVVDFCIKLRQVDRLSITEIQKLVGISRGAVSKILRPYPLSNEEVKIKHPSHKNGGRKANVSARNAKGLYLLYPPDNFTTNQKGKIAEAAALLRLAIIGAEVYSSSFDGDSLDWVVFNGKHLMKVQVRWAAPTKPNTTPVVRLRTSNGRKACKRMRDCLFDFIIGYEYFTDTAYIWSKDEVAHLKNSVTIDVNVAEKWDKILNYEPK